MSDVEKIITDHLGLVYKQLHRFNLGYDDAAKSYAYEALWNAALNFDDSKGIAFSTYATTCIYNSIMHYFREEEKYKRLQTTSIDAVLNEEEGLALIDMIVGSEDVELEKFSIIHQAIGTTVNNLPAELQKKIIVAWIDSNFEATQSELAKELGTSQANVSRTLGTFRNKLRKELEGKL